MYRYQIEFIALKETIAFELTSSNKSDVEEFMYDILSLFSKENADNQHVINSLQLNTTEKKAGIENLVLKYKNLPKLNAVKSFFNKLAVNENFFFLPNIKIELVQKILLLDYLRALKDGLDFEELNKRTTALFGELMSNYTFGVVGEKRIEIGEKIKAKRTCRFCHKNVDLTTFDNKAHAISEALGNKTIVLHDECDKCNKDFSETIEPDIIQYLSLFRTIYMVKGKNRGKGKGGNKQFIGKNFELKNKETVELSFISNDNKPLRADESYNIELHTEQPIISQNIYKALCKYYLSVIDAKYLVHFTKTIDWINGKIEVEKLPKIAEMTSYHSFALQPKLTYFLRKTSNRDIPFAVGEFYFTCKLFAFIVPLSNQDDKMFIEDSEFEEFWKTFKHFNQTSGWIFTDFSNNNKRDFSINLNFQFKKNDEIT